MFESCRDRQQAKFCIERSFRSRERRATEPRLRCAKPPLARTPPIAQRTGGVRFSKAHLDKTGCRRRSRWLHARVIETAWQRSFAQGNSETILKYSSSVHARLMRVRTFPD